MSSFIGMRQLRQLLLGMLTLAAVSVANADSAVTPGSKAAKLGECVAPTQLMRRDHMDMLKHDRDLAVRDGVVEPRFSLADCIACHAEKDNSGGFTPVNAEGQFCESCHSYVAVNLTCFQCHRNTPEENARLSAYPQGHQDLTAQHFSAKRLGSKPAITQE